MEKWITTELTKNTILKFAQKKIIFFYQHSIFVHLTTISAIMTITIIRPDKEHSITKFVFIPASKYTSKANNPNINALTNKTAAIVRQHIFRKQYLLKKSILIKID